MVCVCGWVGGWVGACVRACVRAGGWVGACVRVCLALPPPPQSPFSLSIFFLRFALHRVRPFSLPPPPPPPPPPREKLEACVEHFEYMNVKITVKPNVMFEIHFCAARPAISPGKHFFSFFVSPPPPPPLPFPFPP